MPPRLPFWHDLGPRSGRILRITSVILGFLECPLDRAPFALTRPDLPFHDAFVRLCAQSALYLPEGERTKNCFFAALFSDTLSLLHIPALVANGEPFRWHRDPSGPSSLSLTCPAPATGALRAWWSLIWE